MGKKRNRKEKKEQHHPGQGDPEQERSQEGAWGRGRGGQTRRRKCHGHGWGGQNGPGSPVKPFSFSELVIPGSANKYICKCQLNHPSSPLLHAACVVGHSQLITSSCGH